MLSRPLTGRLARPREGLAELIEHRAGLEPYAGDDDEQNPHDGGEDDRVLGQHVAPLIFQLAVFSDHDGFSPARRRARVAESNNHAADARSLPALALSRK